MPGDWIPMRPELDEEPEVLEIAARVDCSVGDVLRGLLRVWGWFDRVTTDGRIAGGTPCELDAKSMRTGFAQAMEKVGWLESGSDDDGIPYLVMPGFNEYLSKSGKRRLCDAKRHRNSRLQANSKRTPSELKADKKASRCSLLSSSVLSSIDEWSTRWNKVAKPLGVPGVDPKKWSEKRAGHLEARIEDHKDHREGLLDRVVEELPKSKPFDLGWLTLPKLLESPERMNTLLEGGYRERSGAAAASRRGKPTSQDAIAEWHAKTGGGDGQDAIRGDHK